MSDGTCPRREPPSVHVSMLDTRERTIIIAERRIGLRTLAPPLIDRPFQHPLVARGVALLST